MEDARHEGKGADPKGEVDEMHSKRGLCHHHEGEGVDPRVSQLAEQKLNQLKMN